MSDEAMDRWRRDEALKAARASVARARQELVEAQEIYRALDRDVDSLNLSEALVYVDEVLG